MAIDKKTLFPLKCIAFAAMHYPANENIRSYSRERLFNLCPHIGLLETVCAILLSRYGASKANCQPRSGPQKKANILDLPDNVLRKILSSMDPDDIELLVLSTVSRRFRETAHHIGASKEHRSFDFAQYSKSIVHSLEDMVGINSTVKSLTINGRSDRLIASAIHMPHLEELHLTNVTVDEKFAAFLQANVQLRVLSMFGVTLTCYLSDTIDNLSNLSFLKLWGLTVPMFVRNSECFSKLRNLDTLHVGLVDDNMTRLLLERVFTAGAPLNTLVINKAMTMGECLCQMTSIRTLRIESLNDNPHELGELVLRLVNMTEIEVVGATVTRCIEMAFLVGEKMKKMKLSIVRDGENVRSFIANLEILKEMAEDNGIALDIVYKANSTDDDIPEAYLEENSSWLKPMATGMIKF